MSGTSRCRACGTRVRHEQTPLGRVVLLEAEPHPEGERYIAGGIAFSAVNLRRNEGDDVERFREHPKDCRPVPEWEHGESGA